MKEVLIFLFVFLSIFRIGSAQSNFFDFEAPATKELLQLRKMGDAYNYILFTGNRDSIYSVDWENEKLPYEYAYQPLDDDGALGRELREVELIIQVDTSHNVGIPFYPDLPEGLPGKEIPDWTIANRKEVLAIPVYIRNPSGQTTSITVEGVTTSLIQEAKDETGAWQPIEYHVNGFCGNGMYEYILKPGYFIITSVYKYSGSFCTELRIKFKRGRRVYYSNTFKGCINKGQFVKDEYFNNPENFLEELKK